MKLPTPDPAFRWSVEPWGHALRCRPLESIAQHLFTTRQLPLRSDPLAWSQAAASVGATPDRVMSVKQVHGNAVRVIRKGDAANAHDRPNADAVVSNEPGLVLAVGIADCVPLLMADRRTGAAAAVHAGWRGTSAGVARMAIEALSRGCGSNPGDLVVALGPSIGTCCYEVGPELLQEFRAAGFNESQISRWFTRNGAGLLRLDVGLANMDQIHDAGVPRNQIYAANLCTQTHSHIFDSFRAAGANAGRMAAMIRVRS